MTVPAGDYQIRITPAGSTATVVFDSGTIALPGGADLMVLAVDTTGPGAPVQLPIVTLLSPTRMRVQTCELFMQRRALVRRKCLRPQHLHRSPPRK